MNRKHEWRIPPRSPALGIIHALSIGMIFLCNTIFFGCGFGDTQQGPATPAEASPSSIAFNPPTVAFGDVGTGKSASRRIVVMNQGVSRIDRMFVKTVSPGFTVSSTTCGDSVSPISLEGGLSCFLDLVFSPTETGTVSGTLRVYYTKAGTALTTVMTVSGKSVALVTFSSDTTIDSTNQAIYQNKSWLIKSGVTVTLATTNTINLHSLQIEGLGTLTHQRCDTSTCAKVAISVAGDVIIESGGSINVDGKGYLGGNSGENTGTYGRTYSNTIVGGATSFAGGSHGAYGSVSTIPSAGTNAPYGDFSAPDTYGAGGGAMIGYGAAGSGGGVVQLRVAGTLDLNGTISANGAPQGSSSPGHYYYCGAGAGGSIYIDADTLSSTKGSGLITSNGGDSAWAGSGGRIAIGYAHISSGFRLSTDMMTAYGGANPGSGSWGGAGTIYWKPKGEASTLLIDNNNHAAASRTILPILGNLSIDNLIVDHNALLVQETTTTSINITALLSILNNGTIRIPNDRDGNATTIGPWFNYKEGLGVQRGVNLIEY